MPPRLHHICQLYIACRRARPSTIHNGQPYSLSVFTSRFSTCAQQPKFATTRLPSKKPAYLPKRTNKDVTQSGAQSKSAQVDEDYGLEFLLDVYPTMTYKYEELNHLCFEVDCAVRSSWPTKHIVFNLSNDSRKGCPYPLPVQSDVLCCIGEYLFSYVPQRQNLALAMWNIAATMGDSKAIHTLSWWDLSRGASDLMTPLSVQSRIAYLADKRDDLESMTFHARNLSLQNKKQRALSVAMDLCAMTEPGPAVTHSVHGAVALPLPWKSWVNALDYKAAAAPEWQRAWKYGAEIWDDPEACVKAARSTSVVLGTQEWLRFATKAAMAGEASLFQDLGKYYLALHGWFPMAPRVSTTADSKIGFAWLEMAAEFEPLERAANIWAGMALVLREHGNRFKGMKYLQRGFEHIQKREDNGAAGMEKAKTVLRSLFQEWNVKDLVNIHEKKVTSTMFLGQPIIPVPP